MSQTTHRIFKANADGTTEEVELTEDEINGQTGAGLPPVSNPNAVETTDDEDELLSLVAETRDEIVVTKTVKIVKAVPSADGEGESEIIVEKPALIARLSRKESERIAKKRYRNVGGRITLDEDADLTILAWQLHLCVVKNVAAPGAKPLYGPRWTMEQIMGKGARVDKKGNLLEPGEDGLLDFKNAAAETMIDQLQAHIWDVNPSQFLLLLP